MTSYQWYEEVSSTEPLMQGDIIESCPVLVFDSIPDLETAQNADDYTAALKASVAAEMNRIVVMTQACDLEQKKVRNVIACPVYTREEHQSGWTTVQEGKGQRATPEAWQKHLNEIKRGQWWNLALIQGRSEGKLQTPLQIVDFHEVLSLPRDFLEAWNRKMGKERLRLLPPYREHLSQAFARFFMRVGLQQDVVI